MQSEFNFRKFYRPVQPVVKQRGKCVSYIEVFPDELLNNFVYCYWELKTQESLQESFTYRVVADGCIDIFFELNNQYENFVMGFCKKYTEFTLDRTFHYVGVRFLPTAFPIFYNIDAKELSNRYHRLMDIDKETSNYIRDSFSGEDDMIIVKDRFDAYFTDKLKESKIGLDSRFQNALDIILRNFGVINIEKDILVGLSQRQLRRYFEYYIGDSAKTFSQVVRFQNILNAKPSTQSLRESKIFFDLGYYDQAHFIKEFKNFYGVTPSKAFSR